LNVEWNEVERRNQASPADFLIGEFDKALRAIFVQARSQRPMPGVSLPDVVQGKNERRHAAALMRVNHCGEICAQGLYQGQAWGARNSAIDMALRRAASEETDHLAWTEQRIRELGGRTSALNPLWFAASLAVGFVAGRFGDEWSLGFLAETERQVEAHLAGHLDRLDAADRKSWTLLEQMKADEIEHARTAELLGARRLPAPVKVAMSCASRVMTRTAYWV
jgi:ubiquinone biosynthesis monooxygenase Coq7